MVPPVTTIGENFRARRRAAGKAVAAAPVRARAAALGPDLLLLAALALLGLLSLRYGFDAYLLVTGDALYAVQMAEHSLLDYRPPAPNRLFPDVLLHWLAAPMLGDPLAQKLAVGAVLFVASAIAIGLAKGALAFALFVVVTVSGGFEFLVSATHYSLALCVLMVVLARGGRLEWPLLGLIVFSNPMVLVPLAFLLVEPAAPRRHAAVAATVAVAMVLNTLYSEFSESLVHMLLVFPPWFGVVWVATRYGLARTLMISTAGVLTLAVATGLMPGRYGVAVAAAFVPLLFPTVRPAADWRHVVVPGLVLAIFFATADWSRQERMAAGHACVVAELQRRGIDTIAAEHWTAKPLDFAARDASVALTITQTDFARNRVHPWMAPHSYYGEPTPWAVRSDDVCTRITSDGTYCGQAETAAVARAEPICDGFTLYRYETAVPALHRPAPDGKWQAIVHNLSGYVETARRRLGIRAEQR